MNVEAATREVFWHIRPLWLVYTLAAVALLVFAYGCYRRARAWFAVGAATPALGDVPGRLRHTWRRLASHDRFRRDPAAGWMHAGLMGGFLLLFVGTSVVFVHVDLGIPIMQGWFYLVFQKLGLTIAGIALGVACAMALARRYLQRVPRLAVRRPGAPPERGTVLAPALLLVVVVQGFVLQAIRLAANPDPFSAWSPVGHLLALPLASVRGDSLILAYQTLWWVHLATALGFIAWLPFGKMLHAVVGPLNVFAGHPSPLPRALQPIDFDDAAQLGTSRLEHFTWKELLDLDACTACGRCEDACPAHAAGTPLSPRNVILDLRDALRRRTEVPQDRPQAEGSATEAATLPGGTIAEQALWSCTTCSACVQACPIHVEHVPKIVGMRRHLVMEAARLPDPLQDALKTLEDRGHPYKGGSGDRTAWCRDLGVSLATQERDYDVLYWVGCTASFDPRGQRVARSVVELLRMAGLRVAILGNDEPCCGDPARRIGHEFLYDQIARTNVELLHSLAAARIVTACPHCLNALGNEYRAFGGEFDVVHHTQLLQELVVAGRLAVSPAAIGEVTYHDPCYLGRYRGEYDAPRQLIAATADVTVEMKRARSASFCCGGGGGQAWMPGSAPDGKRINEIRAAEAAATGARTLAVGCPFCMRMLEDGVKAIDAEARIAVRDVAEVMLQAASQAQATNRRASNARR